MTRRNRIESNENPRFDLNTGRPFIVNGIEEMETFMKIYLDSTEIEIIDGVFKMLKWFDKSRIGTREELDAYLKGLRI